MTQTRKWMVFPGDPAGNAHAVTAWRKIKMDHQAVLTTQSEGNKETYLMESQLGTPSQLLGMKVLQTILSNRHPQRSSPVRR